MSDISILLIALLVGSGLPIYIFGSAFVVTCAYVGVCALLARNTPLEERRRQLDGPLHAPFIHIMFWVGHPAWSHWWRDEYMLGWVISRSLVGIVTMAIPTLVWLHWWQ